MLPIVTKLLGGHPLEEGEDFEYFPIELELEGAEGHQLLLPKREKTLLFQNWLNISNLFRLKS